MRKIRAEKMVAELNRMRQDLDRDESDIEWLTLHHVFCFVSYQMQAFQAYLDGQAEKGAFDELDD